jgi:S1-C subfamily serine protease
LKEITAQNTSTDIKSITNHIDVFKRSIVKVLSRTDTPFISEIEEVVSTNGFIIDKENLYILTTRKAARMSPSSIKVQFYDGKIVNARVVHSGIFNFIEISAYHLE